MLSFEKERKIVLNSNRIWKNWRWSLTNFFWRTLNRFQRLKFHKLFTQVNHPWIIIHDQYKAHGSPCRDSFKDHSDQSCSELLELFSGKWRPPKIEVHFPHVVYSRYFTFIYFLKLWMLDFGVTDRFTLWFDFL